MSKLSNQKRMQSKILNKMDQLKLAEKMIRYNVRPPLVWTNFPRLNIRCLYDLWRKVHSQPSPSGLLPFSVVSCLRKPLDCVQAHCFLRLYKAESSQDVAKLIDVPAMISAYEALVAMAPDSAISLSTAWYVARDYRIQILHETKCGDCHHDYLVHDQCHHQHKALRDCPFCWAKLKTKTNNKRRFRYEKFID